MSKIIFDREYDLIDEAMERKERSCISPYTEYKMKWWIL